jgi:hypothetical protein
MTVLSAVRICFNESGVWVTADPRSDLPFEIVDVSLGVLDAVA